MRRFASDRRATLTGALLASLALVSPLSSQAVKTPTVKPPKLKPPHADTGRALHVGETSAELGGVVNPHGTETSYYFQYGTTTAYGAQTPTTVAGNGVIGVKVSQSITGLQQGATYHFRIVAVSSSGTTVDGTDRTFATKQTPLKFVINKGSEVQTYGSPFSLAGTLSGTGGANRQVILQTSPFPYMGIFTNVGSPTTTNAVGGFSLNVAGLTQDTKLRVSTLDALPTHSQVVNIHVAVLVTLRVKPTAQKLLRFEGTVTPSAAGAPVVFQLLRSGHKPVNVDSTTVKRGNARVSRFSGVVSIHRGGSYRVLVKVSNGKEVSGASPTVLLHATPRPVHKRHGHVRRRK
jgi:hypothetical protein